MLMRLRFSVTERLRMLRAMDDAAKREVINNDYNERREIMDAKPIEVSIAGRMMSSVSWARLLSAIFRT